MTAPVPLARCLAGRAEHGADRRPGVAFSPGSMDRSSKGALACGPLREGVSDSAERRRVSNVAGCGLVVLEPAGQFLSASEDFFGRPWHQ
jgi:hypothetical protein